MGMGHLLVDIRNQSVAHPTGYHPQPGSCASDTRRSGMSEVRRETTFESDPDEVWHAISDERELERWLGEEVELDPVEGGDVRVVTDGEERTGNVEEVEDGSRLVFTWGRPGEEHSRVEFTVAPHRDGARLVVVESQPATAGPVAAAAEWSRNLNDLSDALRLVLA
jgi:uncharacterized protein YndB with AHSA1/START domain